MEWEKEMGLEKHTSFRVNDINHSLTARLAHKTASNKHSVCPLRGPIRVSKATYIFRKETPLHYEAFSN